MLTRDASANAVLDTARTAACCCCWRSFTCSEAEREGAQQVAPSTGTQVGSMELSRQRAAD